MNKFVKALIIGREDIEKHSIEYKFSDERSKNIFMNGFDTAFGIIRDVVLKELDEEVKEREMNFLEALKLMIKGKKVYSKTIKKENHIIYLDNLNMLRCETCGLAKGITLDMINDDNWEIKNEKI